METTQSVLTLSDTHQMFKIDVKMYKKIPK